MNEFSLAAYKNAIAKMEDAFDPTKISAGAAAYFSLENGVAAYEKIYRAVLD